MDKHHLRYCERIADHVREEHDPFKIMGLERDKVSWMKRHNVPHKIHSQISYTNLDPEQKKLLSDKVYHASKVILYAHWSTT